MLNDDDDIVGERFEGVVDVFFLGFWVFLDVKFLFYFCLVLGWGGDVFLGDGVFYSWVWGGDRVMDFCYILFGWFVG